jgi:hypothetical protein
MKKDHDGACCCTCTWLAVDGHHPCTDGGSILDQKGWVCLAPEFDTRGYKLVFSGWSRHGLCEMWDKRKPAPRKKKAQAA